MKTSFIVVHNGVPNQTQKVRIEQLSMKPLLKHYSGLIYLNSQWKAPNYPIPVVTKQWPFRILQQANIAVQHFTAIILSRKKEKFDALFIKEAFFKQVYQATTYIYICAKMINNQLLYQQTYKLTESQFSFTLAGQIARQWDCYVCCLISRIQDE